MIAVLALVAAIVLGLGAVGTIVVVTWLTFPAANVIRSFGGRGATRFARQALGPTAQLRDLGEMHEANVALGELDLVMTWSSKHTRIEARARGEVSKIDAEAVAELDGLGRTEGRNPLIWSANRPPDPQLKRVVSLICHALSG